MKSFQKTLATMMAIFTVLFISGCANSIQPILVLTPGDIIFFILIDVALSFLLSGYMNNWKFEFGFAFWAWFAIGFLCLPVLIIAAVIKFLLRSKK
jgi:hypothetical protein